VSKVAVREKWRVIGEVAVDTATLVICDPCQMGEVFDRDDELRDLDDDQAAVLVNEHKFPIAVAVTTGLGDGQYAIEARYEDLGEWGRRVAEIRIKFLPHPQINPEDVA
jgi:hypothetical protein